MFNLLNFDAQCSKPFDLRHERKEWWKLMRNAGPVNKELIKRECPRTIKKYEEYVVGEMHFYTEQA